MSFIYSPFQDFDYKKELLELKENKSKLLFLKRTNSKKFKISLKKYFKSLIEIKAHAWCMDNNLERNKMLKLIWQELEDLVL